MSVLNCYKDFTIGTFNVRGLVKKEENRNYWLETLTDIILIYVVSKKSKSYIDMGVRQHKPRKLQILWPCFSIHTKWKNNVLRQTSIVSPLKENIKSTTNNIL